MYDVNPAGHLENDGDAANVLFRCQSGGQARGVPTQGGGVTGPKCLCGVWQVREGLQVCELGHWKDRDCRLGNDTGSIGS